MQVFKKKQPSKRDHVSIYSIDVTNDLIIMAKRELAYSSPSFSSKSGIFITSQLLNKRDKIICRNYANFKMQL